MSRRDDDTRPLEDVFQSIPVYVTECEVKRSQIVDVVNDATTGIDENTTWITRLLYALSFFIILAVLAMVVAAKNHYDLKLLRLRVEARTQEYGKEIGQPRP